MKELGGKKCFYFEENREAKQRRSLWIKLSCRYNCKTLAVNKNEEFWESNLVKRFMIYLRNFILYSRQVFETFHDFIKLESFCTKQTLSPEETSQQLIDRCLEQADVDWIFLRNNYFSNIRWRTNGKRSVHLYNKLNKVHSNYLMRNSARTGWRQFREPRKKKAELFFFKEVFILLLRILSLRWIESSTVLNSEEFGWDKW